jgi:hypothetical protein
LEAGPTRSVVRVIDAETVLLDDNEEVRLIGALTPRSPDLKPDAAPWPPEEAAAAALRDLVVGHSVELASSGRIQDRYGHLLAHLFLQENGERVWVQGRLLSTALSQQLPDRGRERSAREDHQIAHLSRLRPRLAHRFFRWRRRQSCMQIQIGPRRSRACRAGVWRCAAGSSIATVLTSPSRTSQLAVIEDGAHPPPSSPGGPVLSSERPSEPHKRKRPAQKQPGVDL